jgi:hypothetical protein
MKIYTKILLIAVPIVVLILIAVPAMAQKSAAGFGVPMGFEGGPPGAGMSPEMMAGRGGMPGMVPSGFSIPGMRTASAKTQPSINFVKIKDGEKIICAKTGVVLKDVAIKEIPERDLGEGVYFDDGTHGDEKANDMIFSRITVRKDVISQEANSVKEKLEIFCQYVRDMNPVEFYGIYMAAEDPNSNSVSASFLERRRDEFIISYRQRVLENFVNQETGQYYQVFKEKPIAPVVTAPQRGNGFGQPGFASYGSPAMTRGGGARSYHGINRARGMVATATRVRR